MTETNPSPAPSPGEFNASGSLEMRNQIQADYGVNVEPWFRWVLSQAALPSNARVLELGCGTGELWRQNLDRLSPSWQVLLSDASPGMAAGAAHALSCAPIPFHALLHEAQAVPFPSRSFDAVFAVGLFDLLPKLNVALAEIARVLKPGGQLVATAGGRRHLKELEDLLRPLLGEDPGLGGMPERFGLENGMLRLKNFFRYVERLRYPDLMVLDRPEPILEYVLSEDSVRERLAGEGAEALRSRVSRLLEQHGALTVTLEKGLFIAR